jgi:hypothetical protein
MGWREKLWGKEKVEKPKTLGRGGCAFGSSPKQLKRPHPQLVHWWLLVHSSQRTKTLRRSASRCLTGYGIVLKSRRGITRPNTILYVVGEGGSAQVGFAKKWAWFIKLLCVFWCNGMRFGKINQSASQSGDPFVLVLFKCFHNTFTRCPRFSALFV